MEGEGTPFRRVSLLPPNLPHPPRTSPISPPLRKRKFVSFFEGGGDMGEVFVGLGGGNYLKGAASHLFGGSKLFRMLIAMRVPRSRRRDLGTM